MAIINRRYLAYLLRLWQVSDAGKITWRASLEDPHSGNRQGFVSFEALIDYLQELVLGSQNEEGGEQDRANETGE